MTISVILGLITALLGAFAAIPLVLKSLRSSSDSKDQSIDSEIQKEKDDTKSSGRPS